MPKHCFVYSIYFGCRKSDSLQNQAKCGGKSVNPFVLFYATEVGLFRFSVKLLVKEQISMS